MKKNTYCGYIGIIGRTNVGKSTILNQLIDKKISIISKKSGTTQKNITGIKTVIQHQFIYIDTPGIEIYPTYQKKSILQNNNYINIIIFVINKINWGNIENIILEKINKTHIPTILVINKIDHIKNKKTLLPFIDLISKKKNFLDIIPISAKYAKNINLLSRSITKNLPKAKHIFPKKKITTNSKEFIISEIIREKFLQFLNQEIPYCIKIKIQLFYIDTNNIYQIYATIYVKNIRHKKIIIGKKGKKIKICHMLATKNISQFLGKDIQLHLTFKLQRI
ncbi:GTPase Era [Buchnera aphidicola]|uniref:GTPase Era n=1 Tax=Buchnera aphidicola (Sarucallis kahawaluokalani) TaxID=1241878 RepID=A0A4D6Y9W8_9GAMM|nr:GTPase Era [Buchnera aphidicola]QCI25972.1 GTPase Era [Buchnera aphidicola (Sarucallis kahawaluokalani)]